MTDSSRCLYHVANSVEAHLKGEGSGHDWQHICRVRKLAERLAREEGADISVVVLAALLHDVDDRKLTGDLQTEIDLPMARRMMADAGVGGDLVQTVCDTIGMIGFHKSLKDARTRTLEANIVSDADQLDAIGAWGSPVPLSMAHPGDGRCSIQTAAP